MADSEPRTPDPERREHGTDSLPQTWVLGEFSRRAEELAQVRADLQLMRRSIDDVTAAQKLSSETLAGLIETRKQFGLTLRLGSLFLALLFAVVAFFGVREMADLRREVARQIGAEVEKKLVETTGPLDSLTARVGDLERQGKALSGALSRGRRNLGELDRRGDEIAAQFQRLEELAGAYDARLARLPDVDAGLKRRLAELPTNEATPSARLPKGVFVAKQSREVGMFEVLAAPSALASTSPIEVLIRLLPEGERQGNALELAVAKEDETGRLTSACHRFFVPAPYSKLQCPGVLPGQYRYWVGLVAQQGTDSARIVYRTWGIIRVSSD